MCLNLVLPSGKAGAGDNSRIRVDGEQGGAGWGAAVHQQGGGRQVDRDWGQEVAHHLVVRAVAGHKAAQLCAPFLVEKSHI